MLSYAYVTSSLLNAVSWAVLTHQYVPMSDRTRVAHSALPRVDETLVSRLRCLVLSSLVSRVLESYG